MEWVSINDKLPEEKRDVFIRLKVHFPLGGFKKEIAVGQNIGEGLFYFDSESKKFPHSVTDWAPIPSSLLE